MNVNSIFLNSESLIATGGYYGVATTTPATFGANKNFTDQYVNKFMLVDELQNKVNAAAEILAELPADADRTEATTQWRVLKSILDEVKVL